LGLDGRRDGAFLVPAGLDPAKPVPLIVALHGAGGIATQMLDLLAVSAERQGMIVLFSIRFRSTRQLGLSRAGCNWRQPNLPWG
jgi:poly(3-hydroxybutyrate) depolymerase